MKWSNAKLGELCSIEKGKIGIMAATPGKYPLVTTGENRLTHSEWQFDKPAVCIPMVSSTGHGHASLHRVHFQKGQFSAGNILAVCTPFNDQIISAEYLHAYLSHFKDSVLVPLMQGSANVALKLSDLKNIVIPYPSLENQIKLIRKFRMYDQFYSRLNSEFDFQRSQILRLTQQVYTEAFQGILVPQVSGEGRVSEDSLESIKVEKERLILLRKLRQPKISDSGIPVIQPYHLPTNWKWFRLPEVAFFQEGPGIRNWQFRSVGTKLLNVQNITNSGLDLDSTSRYIDTSEFHSKYQHFKIEDGDILLASSGGSWGKSCWFIPQEYDVILNTSTMRFRTYSESLLLNKFLYYYLQTDILKNQLIPQLSGMQPNFGSTHFSKVVIPIPPVKEQYRILEKVERLIQLCKRLEVENLELENIARKLLQAQYREIFISSKTSNEHISVRKLQTN
jgi:type I restriction enzyme, S subunit